MFISPRACMARLLPLPMNYSPRMIRKKVVGIQVPKQDSMIDKSAEGKTFSHFFSGRLCYARSVGEMWNGGRLSDVSVFFLSLPRHR